MTKQTGGRPVILVPQAVRTAALLLALAGVGRAELSLSTVRADKIYYDPGAEARFAVVVTNADAAAAQAVLRVELVSDLDNRRTLVEEPITVAAHGQYSWTGSERLTPVLGLALTATLMRDGQAVASRSDYFSCARSVHQVLIFGMATGARGSFPG